MKNILMGVVALTIGCAMFALLPAQDAQPGFGVKTGKQKGPSVLVTGQPISGTPVTGAPYSAVAITDSTQTLGDGNRIVHSQSQKIYRDSQGRERSEETSGSAVISDPVAKVSYRLNAQTRTATQTPLMNLLVARNLVTGIVNSSVQTELAAVQAQLADLAAATALRAAATASGEAPVKESLAPQNLEGVLSNGTRTTITIPAGQVGNERPIHVVDEVWYSPELQLNVKTVHSDPRGGETVYRLTQIIRSEPDARLFQVPPDYTMSNAGGGRSGGGGRGGPAATTPVPIAATTAARPALTVVSRVEPQYSEEALKARWQGSVTLRLTVDEAGLPHNIAVFKSLGMGLDQKAIEAVSQWRFQPTLLNGAPTQVTTTIDVPFKLQ